MKRILPLLLVCTVLFQSCKVYDSRTTTKEDAVMMAGKVKVISKSNASYKFDKLVQEEDQLYGLGKRLTSQSKQEYNKNIVHSSSTTEYVKIHLTEDLINEIHLYSKGKSGALKILGFGAAGVVLVSVLTFGVILLVFMLGN